MRITASNCLLLCVTLVASSFAHPRHVTKSKLSPEIVGELKDFLHLIPAGTIDELLAEHFITDSGFRHAFKYVNSDAFTALLGRLQELPEIIEILNFLHLTTVDGTQHTHQQQKHAADEFELPQLELALLLELAMNASDALIQPEPQLEIVLLDGEAPPTHLDKGVRTFSSFVEELMQYLPRGRYVEMINEKRQRSAAFAGFYAALRSAQFRPMVDLAMRSPNVADIVKTLNDHSMEVNKLEATAFEVISWGPAN